MNPGNLALLIPLFALAIPIVAIIAGIFKERYRAQRANLSGEEAERLQELTKTADSLAERVTTLEAILDHEVPGWREDHDRHEQ